MRLKVFPSKWHRERGSPREGRREVRRRGVDGNHDRFAVVLRFLVLGPSANPLDRTPTPSLTRRLPLDSTYFTYDPGGRVEDEVNRP